MFKVLYAKILNPSNVLTFKRILIFSLIIQLEDAEFAKTAAVKVRQNLELELSDVQQQLDDVLRGKADTEDRLMRMSREKADLVKNIRTFECHISYVMSEQNNKTTVS